MYMMATALSRYNKRGDTQMERWTTKQPDRIYQFSVETGDIAAYLRVRAGQTQAGPGMYERGGPFVHMRFQERGRRDGHHERGDIVDGVDKGYVALDGSPEYAANLNDFMMRVQALLTD